MTPTPEAAPEVGPRARRAVQISLVLLSATMLLPILAPRYGAFSLVLAPATAAAMITSLVLLRRVRATALKVMLGIGIGLSGFALLYGFGFLLLREPIEALTACQERAITETARRACLDQYEQDYRELLEEWGLTVPAGALP